jgi:N-acetylmuramoyl-L-alanine amidase
LNPKAKKFASLLAAPATIVLGTAASVLLAQAQGGSPAGQAPAMNRAVVVLDAAHGGPDTGAKLGERLLEKDVTLALAARLKAALTSAGFTVVSTRDADSLNLLTADQRAETANRAHAVACLVIHATAAGSGVHLYASTLAPKDPPDASAYVDPDVKPVFEPTPWETAQAESVRQSLKLEGELSAALGGAHVPVVAGRAAVRPLDNMMCPALAVEVAPLVVAGEDTVPVTDPDYQQRLADTLAKALQVWRGEMQPPASPVPAPASPKAAASSDQWQAAAKATAAADAAGRTAARPTPAGGTQ